MKKLTKEFADQCRENPDVFNWCTISRTRRLSEDFIREFQDNVDWYYVFQRQKLSEDFLIEFIDMISTRWLVLESNENVPNDLIVKLKLLKSIT